LRIKQVDHVFQAVAVFAGKSRSFVSNSISS
jgi:hypothetical protein